MTLYNDYTHQLLTDQRERELARMAEQNRLVRQALNGRVSWWRRLVARLRRKQRISAVAECPAHLKSQLIIGARHNHLIRASTSGSVVSERLHRPLVGRAQQSPTDVDSDGR